MMKNLIISTIVMMPALHIAQVGINTASPTATLDVISKNTTGNSTNVDGFIAPRVDRQRAQSMTNVPTSTIIYVNNIATGTQTGTAININSPSFYYFDGSVWQKLVTPAAATQIFSVATKNATQTIPGGGGSDITWQTITGSNANAITLSSGNIILPANKIFLLQGYVSWLKSSGVPDANAWIKYNFVDTSNTAVGSVNIAGFQEASTEQYKDGGVNPSTAIINTGTSPLTIKLRTLGTGAGGSFDLSAGSGNNGTCYILIQEL